MTRLAESGSSSASSGVGGSGAGGGLIGPIVIGSNNSNNPVGTNFAASSSWTISSYAAGLYGIDYA